MNCTEAKTKRAAQKVEYKRERKKQRKCGGWFHYKHAYRSVDSAYMGTGYWYECICCGYVPSTSPFKWNIVERNHKGN